MNETTTAETISRLRDLAARPSLETLAYALRHPETWPEGFVWQYNKCPSCAMGLAAQLWFAQNFKEPRSHPAWKSWAARTFAMEFEAAEKIFYHTLPPFDLWHPLKIRSPRHVTPEHVAAAIDRYLAQRERRL